MKICALIQNVLSDARAESSESSGRGLESGTLEKTVHAVLKNYYAPDEDMHEIPIENFVADIFDGRQ